MKLLDNQKLSKIQIMLGVFFLCLVAVIGFSLLKVFIADTPERSTSKYLKAWKENNFTERKKLSCFSTEVLDVPNFDIQSWSIIETKENRKNLDSRYFSIFVKVNYFYNNSSIKRTIVFDVWNSEELFESAKRSVDKINRDIEGVRESLDSINEALGKPIESQKYTPTVVNRESYSLEKYCIHKIKEDSL